MVDEKKAVKIGYTNYKGETAERTIIPLELWFGSTEYHEEEQWLLKAFDLEKKAERNFAVKDIKSWRP
jgi:predicted DNA-binding transcriptional regulator YafY